MSKRAPGLPRFGVVALVAAVTCVTVELGPALAAAPLFEIAFDRAVSDAPYTGRVYVVTTTNLEQDPLDGIHWLRTEPVFAQHAQGWAPDGVLRFDPHAACGYPVDLADLPAGEYGARAVMDLNGRTQDVLRAPGNGVSGVVRFAHDPANPATVRLRISQRLPEVHLADTGEIKVVRLLSDRLSEFHGRYVHMYAAVALPPGYREDLQRRYPAVYLVDGFGGTVRASEGLLTMVAQLLAAEEFEALTIYLDADCPTGHHVFADSANNGPWGTGLVTELIPYLEQRFRLIAHSEARFLIGASSGGWSTLWLQVRHPETFGGVWALAPDPVDFSAFLLVDIYDPRENFLCDPDGQPRKFSRGGAFGGPIVLLDSMRLEAVLGRGGQFHSFDAVFSPRGADGQPLPLWDRQTGRIDPVVARAWREYDIRRVLESNWKTLGPRLTGKLHIVCGDRDDFFLERAVLRLRDVLARLGSDAEVEIVPGGNHALGLSVWSEAVEQMKARFESRGRPKLQQVAIQGAASP